MTQTAHFVISSPGLMGTFSSGRTGPTSHLPGGRLAAFAHSAMLSAFGSAPPVHSGDPLNGLFIVTRWCAQWRLTSTPGKWRGIWTNMCELEHLSFRRWRSKSSPYVCKSEGGLLIWSTTHAETADRGRGGKDEEP